MKRKQYSHNQGGISLAGLLCLFGTFLVSGSLFWLAAPQVERQSDLLESQQQTSRLPIQKIQPGQWVKANNPGEDDDLDLGMTVDPSTWKLLSLSATKLDGTTAAVSLLRPSKWLEAHHAEVGGTVSISVPECGIEGDARVLQISTCPPIADSPGPGFQIVTGTFRHAATEILDISIEGEAKPIGTTVNHPFWSVDRNDFVRADSLAVGEQLQSLNGIVRVTGLSPRGPPEPVFNLEVQVKHTYHVADSGILVHNGTPCKIIGLGRDPYLDVLKKEFGSNVSFARADGWTKSGLTGYRSDHIDEFLFAFRDATKNADEIIFNLESVKIKKAIFKAGKSGAAVARRHRIVTEWEFFEIFSNESLLNKTKFYLNGETIKGSDKAGLNDLLQKLIHEQNEAIF